MNTTTPLTQKQGDRQRTPRSPWGLPPRSPPSPKEPPPSPKKLLDFERIVATVADRMESLLQNPSWRTLPLLLLAALLLLPLTLLLRLL
jgi:hypothetical protein